VYENSEPPELVVQPDDDEALPREITWMFAALNTVEPPILDREIATLVEHDKTWY
jgi:glutathione S-transferase